jgi:hypothetical protein
LIAPSLEQLDEVEEVFALSLFDGFAFIVQRPPCQEVGDILQP